MTLQHSSGWICTSAAFTHVHRGRPVVREILHSFNLKGMVFNYSSVAFAAHILFLHKNYDCGFQQGSLWFKMHVNYKKGSDNEIKHINRVHEDFSKLETKFSLFLYIFIFIRQLILTLKSSTRYIL